MADGRKEMTAVHIDKETHAMLKTQAKKAKMPMRVYLRLCLINCKSDSIGESK